jgi:hypothetical protein
MPVQSEVLTEEERKAGVVYTSTGGMTTLSQVQANAEAYAARAATVGAGNVDLCQEVVNVERSWQYMIFCRERTGWFHWKVRRLYQADLIRVVLKLKATSRSPGGIFGKDWPKEAYVKFEGPTKKEITLYKKDDWFYGSPRKYHSSDFGLSGFKPGIYKLFVKAAPDGYLETDAQLVVEVAPGERQTGAEALAIGGVIAAGVTTIILIIVLGFFLVMGMR